MNIIFVILVMTLSSLPNIGMFLDEESNGFCILYIFLMISFISMSVLPVGMFMYHMWGWCPEVRRVSNTLGLEVQMVVSECKGLYLYSLQEQWMLLITELSLQI